MHAPTIYERFSAVAASRPTAEALVGPITERLTYRQLDELAVKVSTGLVALGLRPGQRVGILSENRHEWATLDLACNRLGLITVPIHTVFSPTLVSFVVRDAGCSLLACSGAVLEAVGQAHVADVPLLVFDEGAKLAGHVVHGWEELLELANGHVESTARAESSLCTVIYTSGTTGTPKGVCLTDENITSDIDAAVPVVGVTADDTWLSFLPLSHALERTGGQYTPLLLGARIAYARSPATLADDMRRRRPTVLVSVPRVFERAYEKIVAKASATPLKKRIFHWALRASRSTFIHRRLADLLVWSKVRTSLGGRLSKAISGGASLNPAIAKFFHHARLSIIEGYGLTETAPIVSVNLGEAVRVGTVGKPLPGVRVEVTPEKELVVRGPNVALGYWRATGSVAPITSVGECVEPFREPGTFYTGDLGHIDADGYLTIIGRAKELIVLPNGKKVNPVAIEQRLELSEHVDQAFVYHDAERRVVSALVVPSARGLEVCRATIGTRAGGMDNVQLVAAANADVRLRKLFDEDFDRHETHLPEYEQANYWQLTWPPFTQERDELTPTLKLRRAKVMERLKG